MMPDGPPPMPREVGPYYMQMADGVEEGYAAFYHQQPASDVITVFGLRFADPNTTDLTNAPKSKAYLIRLGSTVAMVTGAGGPCFDALGAFIRSLRQ
jgi:hypothetical protein